MSHPLYLTDVIKTTTIIYYTFNGVPELYKSPYEIAELKKIAMTIHGFKKGKETYLYFNNDINCSAVRSAIEMKEIGGSKKFKRFEK